MCHFLKWFIDLIQINSNFGLIMLINGKWIIQKTFVENLICWCPIHCCMFCVDWEWKIIATEIIYMIQLCDMYIYPKTNWNNELTFTQSIEADLSLCTIYNAYFACKFCSFIKFFFYINIILYSYCWKNVYSYHNSPSPKYMLTRF